MNRESSNSYQQCLTLLDRLCKLLIEVSDTRDRLEYYWYQVVDERELSLLYKKHEEVGEKVRQEHDRVNRGN